MRLAVPCLALLGLAAAPAPAQTNAPAPAPPPAAPPTQLWNFHVADTEIVQWHPNFPAAYSGLNSLNHHAEGAETVDLEFLGGARLWSGAEFHLDELFWQGFGLSKTLGVEAFPSAEAYKIGANRGNEAPIRVFICQTINLGDADQDVAADALHLRGRQSDSRVVLTVGEISAIDIFDNNSYAGDPTTQFLNWAFVGNEGWDYPANSLGFITGAVGELYQPGWALRYGFFQLPRVANGMAIDDSYLRAWGMVTEFERDFQIGAHPGAVRLLAYANRAHMGQFAEALDNPIRPADVTQVREYRIKWGLGLNAEQEITRDIGVFTRLGWNDGQHEGWVYSDVDRSASVGVSVKGTTWLRPDDTIGVAGVASFLSTEHRRYLEAGGIGILDGDGALDYGVEKAMEAYYSFAVWKTVRLSADYQFIDNPANNRDRGPVSVLGGRLHFDF